MNKDSTDKIIFQLVAEVKEANVRQEEHAKQVGMLMDSIGSRFESLEDRQKGIEKRVEAMAEKMEKGMVGMLFTVFAIIGGTVWGGKILSSLAALVTGGKG